jgi:hypothetical protein
VLAKLVIGQHGEDAELRVSERSEKLLEQGGEGLALN